METLDCTVWSGRRAQSTNPGCFPVVVLAPVGEMCLVLSGTDSPTCWKRLKVANRRTSGIDFLYGEHTKVVLLHWTCVWVDVVTAELVVLFPDPDRSHLSPQITHTHTQLQWPFPGVETQSQWAAVRKLPAQQGFVFFWRPAPPTVGKTFCLSVHPSIQSVWDEVQIFDSAPPYQDAFKITLRRQGPSNESLSGSRKLPWSGGVGVWVSLPSKFTSAQCGRLRNGHVVHLNISVPLFTREYWKQFS